MLHRTAAPLGTGYKHQKEVADCPAAICGVDLKSLFWNNWPRSSPVIRAADPEWGLGARSSESKWPGLKFIELLPDSSVGKKPTCNAGEPGSTPGLGRSAGEGQGYSL